MLLRTTKSFLKNNTLRQLRPTGKKGLSFIVSKRFQSTIDNNKIDPKVTSTNLFDDNDPQRSHMFKYSWGTWLKNDEVEKNKRLTKFSINGLNSVLKRLSTYHIAGLSKENPDEVKAFGAVKGLTNNFEYLLGDKPLGDIKQVVSLHEGKHNRIYTIIMENDRKLILRLPYNLGSQLFTERKIQSEVATMDFLSIALNLNTPRVLAYSGNVENDLGHAFILMECIENVEGSLMKKWNPLVESKDYDLNDANAKKVLGEVIDPIADFQKIVGDFIFDNYGSLYFKDDCPHGLIAYEEQERWVIGPTVEAAYYKNKELLKPETMNKFVGPWKRQEPLKMIKDLASLELESLKVRLTYQDGQDLSNKFESIDDLKDAISVYEKFLSVSDKLFDLYSKMIPNIEELLKPRLFIADLDPMNILIQKNQFEFIDFENSTVKPFLLTNYPKFIEYNGLKIFNLKEEVENFDKLDDLEKQQYEFMFNRTRNQFYWELSLNERSKELLGVISPAVKLIKNCYLSALDSKNLKDYLYVENGLVELSMMWDNYSKNGLVGKCENPLKFTEEELTKYESKFNEYQREISSTPFFATGGWVPQDMFNNLVSQGMLVKQGDEWTLDTEKVLR